MSDQKTRERMITREEAIDVLFQLENSEILSDELVDQISQINLMIQAETLGKHFWGADADDYAKVHTAYREDLWTDELIRECQDIDFNHTFDPAPYEEADIENNIKTEIFDKEEPEELPFT